MANYKEWNEAIIAYFLQGVPRGSKIYLNVDDDLLEYIGQNFSVESDISWNEDFQNAVRLRVVVENRVDLSGLQDRNNQSHPICVAFLSACVLAAYRMGEQEISDRNYFTQLRQILGLPTNVHGRPHGMEQGYAVEEPLWQEWSRWLHEEGYLASAQAGEGPKTYINYPISQSILRYTDKNKLKQLFSKNNWTQLWAKQTLMAYTRQRSRELTKHIKELVNGSRHSYNAVSSAIYEVYEDYLENGLVLSNQSLQTSRSAIQNRSRILCADIYRTENYLNGEIEYYLYPKQPRGFIRGEVEVSIDNTTHTLVNDRPGWYEPLSAIGINKLVQGARYSVVSPDPFNSLILPQRDFWILVQDPDEESSAYAPWDSPKLGECFILLCKQELRQDLERLREEGLIQWDEEIEPFSDSSVWLELHQCMIISQDWDEVIIRHQELKEALQPRDYLSINLSGGLRVHKLGGWLENQEPLVTISGFYPRAKITVKCLKNNQKIIEKTCDTNTAFSLHWAGSGDYLITAEYAGEPVERLVKIVGWEDLPLQAPANYQKVEIDSWQICGGIIQPR